MLKIVFELKDFESVEICTISDVHIGNELCDIQTLHDLISYVNSEPDDPMCARICVLNGDLTESVTRKSVGNLFQQTMTPSVQVATMIKMLKPLAEPREKYPDGKILAYCGGNHDTDRYKDTGITASENIAVGLGIEDRYSPNGCYSFIKLKRIQDPSGHVSTLTLYNQHMTGSASTVGGKANRALKMNGVFADVYIGSHVHQPITFKEDIVLPNRNQTALVQKTMTYVITGSFLRFGDYAQRMGMKPSTILMPRIFANQDRRGSNSERYFNVEVRL